MECLKMLHELSVISQRLDSPFLRHFFKSFDPLTNKNLASAINHFHLSDLESSDYRSAYHQLCDWFYGWNVTDATDYTGTGGPGAGAGDPSSSSSPPPAAAGAANPVGGMAAAAIPTGPAAAEHFRMKRVPRDISLLEEGERAECERIVKTFDTLFVLSRRVLKRKYLELEELVPRIGQGLGTMLNTPGAAAAAGGGPGGGDGAPAAGPGGGGAGAGGGGGGGNAELDEGIDVDKEDVWRKRTKTPEPRHFEGGGGGVGDGEFDGGDDEQGRTGGGGDDDDEMDSLDGSFERLNRRISKVSDGLVVRRKTVVRVKDKSEAGTQRRMAAASAVAEEGEGEGDGSAVAEDEVAGSSQLGDPAGGGENSIDEASGETTAGRDSTKSVLASGEAKISPRASLGRKEAGGLGEKDGSGQAAGPTAQEAASPIVRRVSVAGTLPNQGYQFMKPNTMKKVNGFRSGPNENEVRHAIQRDVNYIYAHVDKCFDFVLLCISIVMLNTAFSELLKQEEPFKKCITHAHELSGDLVSNILKTIWDLLNRELRDVTLEDLRNPERLRTKLLDVMALRATPEGKVPNYKFRRLHKKLTLAHELFSAYDIFLFPTFVPAHRETLKAAHFSAFDSSLWLTGGYDGAIRIHDIRPSSGFVCLAQYMGHKSIVTDVHFTRDDAHIVSSSFDRTVKIWNSQSASCVHTLLGHTDSVTSCDVTPDARHVASGSIDCTVRVWDFATGECAAVIKKHQRWVKVVRFSADGRYLITAGLEYKIYVWDMKILLNSRAITHSRCIEAHSDYVLDLATARPSLLLTASRDSTVRMFDYMTGHELYCVSLAPSWACTVSFSHNGQYFATGSFDNNVIVFRAKDGQRMRELRVLNLGVTCVRFPRDLRYLNVGTMEGFLQQLPLAPPPPTPPSMPPLPPMVVPSAPSAPAAQAHNHNQQAGQHHQQQHR